MHGLHGLAGSSVWVPRAGAHPSVDVGHPHTDLHQLALGSAGKAAMFRRELGRRSNLASCRRVPAMGRAPLPHLDRQHRGIVRIVAVRARRHRRMTPARAGVSDRGRPPIVIPNAGVHPAEPAPASGRRSPTARMAIPGCCSPATASNRSRPIDYTTGDMVTAFRCRKPAVIAAPPCPRCRFGSGLPSCLNRRIPSAARSGPNVWQTDNFPEKGDHG